MKFINDEEKRITLFSDDQSNDRISMEINNEKTMLKILGEKKYNLKAFTFANAQ